MKRYIILCLLWGCFAVLWGQTNGGYGGSYDPANPANPLEPSLTMKFGFAVTASDGGTASYSPSGTEFTSGTYISLHANPNTGYKFLHWMVGDSIISTSRWHRFNMPAHDVEVKAVFRFEPDLPDNPDVVPLTYKVTAEASPSHAGSVNYNTDEVHVGSHTYVSASPNTGYRFKGWELDGTVVSTESYYYFEMGSKDVHYVALFEFDPTVPGNPSNNPDYSGTYTLSYVVGETTYYTQQVPAGATLTAVKSPTKRGYTFDGWKNVPSTMPAKNLTIEGSFTINKYAVAFEIEGDTVHSAEVEYNALLSAPEVAEREGHTLVWENLPTRMPDADVVVKGNYVPNKYKLTYIVDGEEHASSEVVFGSALLPEADPVKVGHTFSGWSEIPATMPAKDVTITGSFAVNYYELAYEIEGEIYRCDTLAYGTSITTAEAPVKEGYSFSGWGGVPATMPAKDLVLSGSYTINQYTLTYTVDGVEYKKATLDYGTAITAEAEPTKEGHTFSGWSEIPATMPAKDVAVVGTFTANKYAVVYTLDGEAFRTDSVTYGTAIVLAEAPAKEGHTFAGWSETPATMPAKDVTIAGTYTVNQYTLTYTVDGVEYKKATLDYGTAITAEAEPTKEGHTFSGWSEIPATMPAKDVAVSGTFTANKYAVVYTLDGEAFRTDSVTYGTAIVLAEAPAKEGHTFAGWSETPATMPAKDVTIAGTYTVNQYTLTYTVDGVEYKKATLDYGTAITAEAEPTKEGHTFSGWSEIPATMPAKDVTIVGEFSVNSYQVTYMLDGKEFKTEQVAYGSPVPTPEVPAKPGYNFSGWGEVPGTMPAKDLTLHGSYTVNKDNKYNVIYMVDGVEFKRVQYAFEDAVVPETEPTKEGHTFSGWSEIPSTMPLHDVTVVGEFTVNVYQLTYVVDGEVYATELIAYGSAIILKDAPVKEGYIFSGWSDAPETMPASDVTIEGSFTVDGIETAVTHRLVDVYTLQGVMVKRQIPVEELEQELPDGIYIVNGKKMVVK